MTSVAAQPLSLVYVGGGPDRATLHFGANLRTVDDYRDAIADLGIADKGLLRAMAKAIVEATGGDA